MLEGSGTAVLPSLQRRFGAESWDAKGLPVLTLYYEARCRAMCMSLSNLYGLSAENWVLRDDGPAMEP